MTPRLEGRSALVTGANRGIGYAVARLFAREGARVLLAGRDLGALDKVADEIRHAGGDAEVLAVTLDDPASVTRLAHDVASLTDRLDVFVANAASLGARKPLLDYPLDAWQRTFRVNVEANLLLLQGLDAVLRASDAARVIMLSAGVARQGKATTGSYAVSKAALEAIVRIYAVEAKDTNIRINAVNPGPTRTAMRARAAPDEDPMTIKTPEDIAPLFVELAAADCQRQGEVVSADAWLAERRR
jgi:NAD(P)-dependent dehydrogenase (short-subunit alcohol dehydrogenase family)